MESVETNSVFQMGSKSTVWKYRMVGILPLHLLTLRENNGKTNNMTMLPPLPPPPDFNEEETYLYHERAGMLEDSGCPRREAEQRAVQQVREMRTHDH